MFLSIPLASGIEIHGFVRIDDIVDEISGELFYESDRLIGSIVWDEKEWEFKKKFPLGINIMKDGKEL